MENNTEGVSQVDSDVMGGESISSLSEVQQEPAQAEPANSEQETRDTQAVPYDRFQKVNTEKNEYKQKYEDVMNNINSYMAANGAQETSQEQAPIESMDDLMTHIDSMVSQKMAPVQQTLNEQKYTASVNGYFASNPEANEMRSDIDNYYQGLSNIRKSQVVESVLAGDTTVLDEIKNTVKLQHTTNLGNMAAQQAVDEASKAMPPSNTRITKQTDPTVNDLVDHGKKTGDFNAYFSALASTAV